MLCHLTDNDFSPWNLHFLLILILQKLYCGINSNFSRITKVKTEYTNLMWGNSELDNKDSKKGVIKISMHREQGWKYREDKLYKLTDTVRQIYVSLQNSNIFSKNRNLHKI